MWALWICVGIVDIVNIHPDMVDFIHIVDIVDNVNILNNVGMKSIKSRDFPSCQPTSNTQHNSSLGFRFKDLGFRLNPKP